MRRDLKKYFEAHFGSFVPVTAHEIEQACSTASPLAGLEGFLYLKKGHTISFKQWMIFATVIRKALTDAVNECKN